MFTQFILGCNTAATAILKGCKAYAQAVGQQAKEIDGKVCADRKTGNAKANPKTDGLQGKWSCSASGSTATPPSATNDNDSFKKRFGELKGHDVHVGANG